MILSFPIVPTNSDDIEIQSELISDLISLIVIDHILVNIFSPMFLGAKEGFEPPTSRL